VLRSLDPIEREIEAENGTYYMRRVLPYRTQDNGVEGVVITLPISPSASAFSDQLVAAKRQAEQANAAKSRFLAAASHDLRQPLQTLALVQGCWRGASRAKRRASLLGGWTRRWRHVGHVECVARHQSDRDRHCPP